MESSHRRKIAICGSLALSIIEKKKNAFATKKYQLLKAEYNGQTFVIFSVFNRKIS